VKDGTGAQRKLPDGHSEHVFNGTYTEAQAGVGGPRRELGDAVVDEGWKHFDDMNIPTPESAGTYEVIFVFAVKFSSGEVSMKHVDALSLRVCEEADPLSATLIE